MMELDKTLIDINSLMKTQINVFIYSTLTLKFNSFGFISVKFKYLDKCIQMYDHFN